MMPRMTDENQVGALGDDPGHGLFSVERGIHVEAFAFQRPDREVQIARFI